MENKTEQATKECSKCGTQIPAKAIKCPNCHSDLRSWFRRHPILTGFFSLFILTFVFGLGSSSKNKKIVNNQNGEVAGTETSTQASQSKSWVKVIEVSGNANKRTDLFHLNGGKARLSYSVNGGSAVLMAAYVMDEGKSLDKQGGFPEVTVSEAGSDSTYLVKSAGNYYLDITSANANWTVSVEEER